MAVCGRIWVAAFVALSACSSRDAPPPQTAADPALLELRAEMLRSLQYPCPQLRRPAHEAPPSAARKVFAEVLLFEGPTAAVQATRLADLSPLQRDPSLRLLAAPHVMPELEHRAELTLVDQIGASQEASLHRLALLPRETSDGSIVLELGVTLQLSNPTGVVPAPTGTSTLTVTGAAQQLLLGTAALAHRQDRALLALVKYWHVHDEQDLRGIFECKMQQRQAELRRRG
jgi:hypothetical protein